MTINTGSSPARWRSWPLLVGIAGALVTLLVWFAVQQREIAVREHLIEAHLAGAGMIVKTHLQSSINAVRRMTRRWEIRDRAVHAEWLADAALYVTHYADYRALLWLGADGSARWWVTRTATGIATDRDGADARWVEPLLAACRTGPGPFCAPAEALSQNRLLIILPITRRDRVAGRIAGVFDLERLFSEILHPEALPAYGIAITAGGRTVYQRAVPEPPPAGPFRETRLDLPGLDWRLRLWPAPGEMTHAPSLLSAVILAAGLLMSGLLAVSIRLAQQYARRSIEHRQAATACASAGGALRESEARYRAVVEDQSELICRFTPDGVLTFVNSAYGRYFSALPSELIGGNWLEFLPPEERADVRRRFQSLTPANPVVTYQHRAILPSGEARWQEWTDRAIFDAHGRLAEYQSVGRDITGRRQEEEWRLKLATQQRDALVREVHHRIKNNLQGVMGLLRERLHAHPDLDGVLEDALAQIRSIATVHGLHSRTPHRNLRLDELVRAVAQATADIGPSPTGISLELSERPVVELADTEAVPIALIVNELICNAVKHGTADDEPPVKITLACDGTATRLRIENPSPALPLGFDFERGTGLGTGLGLVRSLLPAKGASLRFAHTGRRFEAELCLQTPVIAAIVGISPEPGSTNHEQEENPDRR